METTWARAPYDAVSSVYERLMADVFEERQAPLVRNVIDYLDLDPSAGPWAEVACGVGTMARFLSGLGWTVYASDLSEPMLRAARARATEERASVDFACQDMRSLLTPAPCAVASCFFDSLNILTRKADLERTFRAVARCLLPGGIFVFDAVTPYQVRHMFDYCDQFHEGDGFFGAWQVLAESKSNIATVSMRWFIQRDDGLFHRADEKHRIRGYTKSEIQEALRQTGFELIAAYEGDQAFLSPTDRKTMRVDYIARRKDPTRRR